MSKLPPSGDFVNGIPEEEDKPLPPISIVFLHYDGGKDKRTIYHRPRNYDNCVVFACERKLAQRCSGREGYGSRDDIPGVRVACPDCLSDEKDSSTWTPCTMRDDSRQRPSSVLRWGRTNKREWFAVVVYRDQDRLTAEVKPGYELLSDPI